jgi:ABC-type multidrug transport system ATPase subunit
MIEARGVSYMRGRPVLESATLSVAAGECIGLIGDPAAATALLHIMSGWVTPDAGSVYLQGHTRPARLRELRSVTAYASADALPGDGLRVDEYLRFIAHIRPGRRQGLSSPAMIVQQLGVSPDATITDLNRQRRLGVAVAAAMSSPADILFVDHALEMLDEPVRHAIQACLNTVRKEGTSVVVTARDEDVLATFVHRVVRLDTERAREPRAHAAPGPERC